MKKILSFYCWYYGLFCSRLFTKNANPISLLEESTIQSIDVTVGEETENILTVSG